jgi:hypothetical protein
VHEDAKGRIEGRRLGLGIAVVALALAVPAPAWAVMRLGTFELCRGTGASQTDCSSVGGGTGTGGPRRV